MASHDRRQSSRWVGLLSMMASTTSALSLTSFQPITATTVHLGCILAYNYQISGCTIADFTRGNTCSVACVKSLIKIQYAVQAACPNVNVDAASVLGQALLGNLVDLVCSVRPTSTTTPAAATTTETEEPQTSTTETETEEPETSTSTFSLTTALDTSISTSAQFSPTTSASPPSSSSSSSSTITASPEPTTEDSSGGGSPFDVASSDSRQLTSCWPQTVAVAVGLSLLLLH
ncbi:hypothetical protein N657DRAFT_415882 [Parathielavia appendiculata]|uniref:Extracellular membrane protein CFEM domain-containing protein n=1 Tax=Parathielavia appendiculata TaxID=2587402 RepID=A0AAN6TZH2_9PEZI|nr:hypothetical protein N657DRAFT_415882 [Parathielavia appendiculata]